MGEVLFNAKPSHHLSNKTRQIYAEEIHNIVLQEQLSELSEVI